MEHSPRAPFRITEAELHQWFEAATRPSRATTMFHLIESLGRPLRAAELVRRCARFRQAWQDHRHLLRPLSTYAPSPAALTSEVWTSGAGARDSGPLSSSRPAGEASSLPAGPLGEVEWSFTRFPDGRIVLEVSDAPH